MKEITKYTISCGGAKKRRKGSDDPYYKELEYREEKNDRNVRIKLTDFIRKNYNLPDRCKDLLEIAGYLFAADRITYRGKDDSDELHSWSREFEIHIKVRDKKFWERNDIKELLSNTLQFITGDHKYTFHFYQQEEPDFPSSLFDDSKFTIDTKKKASIVLFSGGLDSLAGVIERLEESKEEICLVSHQSGQGGVISTQNKLFAALTEKYPGRCKHYTFNCGLHLTPTIDESQRTRGFLYTSVAFVLAHNFKQDTIYVPENGITSLNLPMTQDLMNGRASRTTHPKTIGLLQKLFTLIHGKEFKVIQPYLLNTKTEVIEIIKKYKREDLICSSVTCSNTRQSKDRTHCGKCIQCIDRIFATHGAEIQEYDHKGLYLHRFCDDLFDEGERLVKVVTDYIAMADQFGENNMDEFYGKWGYELLELIDYMEGMDENEIIRKFYDLSKRHSQNIEVAMDKMRSLYDKLYQKKHPRSFYALIVDPRRYKEADERKEKTQRKLIIEYLNTNYPNFLNEFIDESKAAKEITEKIYPELSGKEKKRKINVIRVEIVNMRAGKITIEVN